MRERYSATESTPRALLLPSRPPAPSRASSTLRDYFKKLEAKRDEPSSVSLPSSLSPLFRDARQPSKRKGRNPLSLPTVGLVGVGRFACNLVYLLKRAEQPVYLNETLPREFILPSRVRCDRIRLRTNRNRSESGKSDIIGNAI